MYSKFTKFIQKILKDGIIIFIYLNYQINIYIVYNFQSILKRTQCLSHILSLIISIVISLLHIITVKLSYEHSVLSKLDEKKILGNHIVHMTIYSFVKTMYNSG